MWAKQENDNHLVLYNAEQVITLITNRFQKKYKDNRDIPELLHGLYKYENKLFSNENMTQEERQKACMFLGLITGLMYKEFINEPNTLYNETLSPT